MRPRWPIPGRTPTPAWIRLHEEVLAIRQRRPEGDEDRYALFVRVWELTEAASDTPASDPFALFTTSVKSREPIPHLSEPWYC